MNAQQEPLLLAERQDNVMVFTFNRPESLNAFNLPMMEALDRSMKEVEQDEGIRVVILRGNGRAYSAGMDNRRGAELLDQAEAHMFETCKTLRRMDKVSIASVHGHCYLGAFILSSSCDFIAVAENANIVVHGGVGVVPEWVNYAIGRLGHAAVRRVQLADEPLSGRDAHNFGIAHWLFPDAELQSGTLELARRIALRKTAADVAATKELLNRWAE